MNQLVFPVMPIAIFQFSGYGIDQIAMDSRSGKLFVDDGRELLIIDPQSGEQTGLVHAGDAMGVCIAQRKPHTPIHEVVSVAP